MARGKYDRAAAREKRERALLESHGVNPGSTKTVTVQPKPSDEELARIDRDIRTTFRVLDRVTDGIVTGDVRGLLLTGTKGIGKTEAIERKLRVAEQKGEVKTNWIGGTMSGIVLYQELYSFRKPGQVLVLDDCDNIFFDNEPLNILKHALDTKDVRNISWKKESSILAANDVPTQFEYEGSMIFLSNMNMLKEINSGSKLAAHFDALVNRTMWIDTGIHNRWEVMVRIKQIVFSNSFMNEQRISSDEVEEMVMWIEDHINHVHSLSIRTVVQLAKMIRMNPEDWIEDAEVILLKKVR
jgi:hypothetical protein